VLEGVTPLETFPPSGVALRTTCRCTEFHRVKKRKSPSPVLHSCNVKTQICVTRPQCVKILRIRDKNLRRLVVSLCDKRHSVMAGVPYGVTSHAGGETCSGVLWSTHRSIFQRFLLWNGLHGAESMRSCYSRTALFWVITQRVFGIPCRRFGTTYRSHLQGPRMIPKGCTETSVMNYHYSLWNNPEDRSSRLFHGGSLTLRRLMSYIYIYIYIYDISSLKVNDLTLILLTWRKWWAPNNASK